ncbi:hypothetical protein AB205_0222110 [Aquarana catesbeiana]|uniref:Uncharacterized protein n=1 Tax=Aquarana catesbeiana TaxID=8400 RepID=A0A2G9S2Z7_AQUCT|nr:hypothetical protein AB205_0222110 [Aquarana catesbeiana]
MSERLIILSPSLLYLVLIYLLRSLRSCKTIYQPSAS